VANQNTAYGANALYSASIGFNTAVGNQSLNKNTSGTYNVALGWKADYALTTGSNNIDIGNQGLAADSGTIRIGTLKTVTQATQLAPLKLQAKNELVALKGSIIPPMRPSPYLWEALCRQHALNGEMEARVGIEMGAFEGPSQDPRPTRRQLLQQVTCTVFGKLLGGIRSCRIRCCDQMPKELPLRKLDRGSSECYSSQYD
jgi:hypothetical protein